MGATSRVFGGHCGSHCVRRPFQHFPLILALEEATEAPCGAPAPVSTLLRTGYALQSSLCYAAFFKRTCLEQASGGRRTNQPQEIDLKNKKPYLLKIPPEELLLPGAPHGWLPEQGIQQGQRLSRALGGAEPFCCLREALSGSNSCSKCQLSHWEPFLHHLCGARGRGGFARQLL